MPLVYRRLLGLLVATSVLAGAGLATFHLEARGDALARARAGQVAQQALARARDSLRELLRAVEARGMAGASVAPLREWARGQVPPPSAAGSPLASGPWWRRFREEFSLHVLAQGERRHSFAPGGAVLAADLSPLLELPAERSVASALVLAGGAPHLAASALVDTPESGLPTRLVLARPLTVADLELLAHSAGAGLVLADARGTLLARVGSLPLSGEALGALLAGDGEAPRAGPHGEWAAARARVADDVLLWAHLDTREHAALAREPQRALLPPLWTATLLVAGAALAWGLRRPQSQLTQELLERTNARLAAAEAQIKRLTTSLPAVRPQAPAPARRPQGPRQEPTPETPQPFGRYELLRPIGQGGMARVYLALARGTGGFERLFVIKRLLEPLAHQPQMVALFMDEARLGASLIHSNIIPVYDFGEVDGEYYMASEYILGRDLDVVVRRALRVDGRALEPASALWVARQALEALGYAHARTDARGQPLGLVHRDVSPMNILASGRGEVKLFDFGIAKSSTRSTQTKAGLVRGNVHFMAPEQARGHAVDARADLFSLGLTLYWCLTGQLLYQAPTDYDLLLKAAAGPSEADWERLAQLPGPCAPLLARALQPSPAERFQTAEEFSLALPPLASAGAATLATRMLRLFGDELRAEAASRFSSRPPPPPPPSQADAG